jgi:hypothetical protein
MNAVKRRLISLAIVIKATSKTIRTTGGCTFLLSLILGVIWMTGREIEPAVFVTGAISSLLLSMPSVASYFVPDRKPIRHMALDDLITFVPTTNPKTDWKLISRSSIQEVYVTEDPRLRYKIKYYGSGIQAEDFAEDWTTCHPNKKATGYWCDLYYGYSFIDRILIVSVDGGRAMLAAPRPGTNIIDRYNYHVSLLFDSGDKVDQYIVRSGLAISITPDT